VNARLLLACVFALLWVAPVSAAERMERVVEVRLGAKHRQIMSAEERFLDVEGALRSAKTWSILMRLRREVDEYPGIKIAIARWTEGDLNQKLVPSWREVCAWMGGRRPNAPETDTLTIGHGTWNAKESSYDFPNGSRVYCVHLKSNQRDNRFAAVRGLTVAKFYIDQLEEVPSDVYDEAALRLSQPGFPQQMIVSPNPVPDSHWIAKRWPDSPQKWPPNHRLIQLAMRDNAHNLDAETIAAAETLYPVGHPLRRVKIEGRRGLHVDGTPVYAGAFNRDRHVRALSLIDTLPLYEAYDYGYHHPCVIWYQYAPWGWVRILGGILGNDMHLDDFLPVVERKRQQWFPTRLRLHAVCDPAGANQNSQGLKGTPVGVLRDWYQGLGERDEFGKVVTPRFQPDANMPERRNAANKILATYMKRQVNGDEAFLVDPERWIEAGFDVSGKYEERFQSFCVDGLEAGYVLEQDARHSQRLGTFYVPKKDGYFEHPMNCTEYGVLMDVKELPKQGQRAAEAQLQHGEKFSEKQARIESARLRKLQKDDDDDRPARRRVAVSRGGY
jgi:hypothetical protein